MGFPILGFPAGAYRDRVGAATVCSGSIPAFVALAEIGPWTRPALWQDASNLSDKTTKGGTTMSTHRSG